MSTQNWYLSYFYDYFFTPLPIYLYQYNWPIFYNHFQYAPPCRSMFQAWTLYPTSSSHLSAGPRRQKPLCNPLILDCLPHKREMSSTWPAPHAPDACVKSQACSVSAAIRWIRAKVCNEAIRNRQAPDAIRLSLHSSHSPHSYMCAGCRISIHRLLLSCLGVFSLDHVTQLCLSSGFAYLPASVSRPRVTL